ncbi:MAG: glycosyltransferase [Bacteroidia bacterium]
MSDTYPGNPQAGSLPKISVVVVNFNLAQYLVDALDSIVDQRYPNLELIVVDGGSKDGSVEVIQRYAELSLVGERTGPWAIRCRPRASTAAPGRSCIG